MVWAPALAAAIQAARQSKARLRTNPLLALVNRFKAAGKWTRHRAPQRNFRGNAFFP
jgi:hypothetical protein